MRKSKSHHTLVSPSPTAKEHKRSRKCDRETPSLTKPTKRHENPNIGLRIDQKHLDVNLTSHTSSKPFEREAITPQLQSTGEQNNSLHNYEPHVDDESYQVDILRIVKEHETKVDASIRFMETATNGNGYDTHDATNNIIQYFTDFSYKPQNDDIYISSYADKESRNDDSAHVTSSNINTTSQVNQPSSNKKIKVGTKLEQYIRFLQQRVDKRSIKTKSLLPPPRNHSMHIPTPNTVHTIGISKHTPSPSLSSTNIASPPPLLNIYNERDSNTPESTSKLLTQ